MQISAQIANLVQFTTTEGTTMNKWKDSDGCGLIDYIGGAIALFGLMALLISGPGF